MSELRKLPKFIHQCMTIGELPTSYKMSLTYEEQLIWFCKFLQDEVIPVVNNNSEVVQELKNYFENLDVQEEINNKLDEMAESGELEEIIGEYLNANCVLAFNTIAEMVNAENLINGSICKTLGATTYNDGNGAYYKVRTMTSSDVVDGVNKIALNVSNTLIAELIPYTKLKPVIDNMNIEIAKVQRNAIYFGNSYTEGIGSTSNHDGIYKLTKDLFKNAYKFTGSGAGFLPHTDHENNNFLTLLQDAIDDTTIDKSTITDIIIVGAWGDSSAYHEFGKSDFVSRMNTACDTFVAQVKANYPNVNRISYVWAEGRKTQTPYVSHPSVLSDEFNVHNLFKFLLPRHGISYLGWIGFNITLRSQYFASDNVHPNDLGYSVLASSFKEAYCGNLVYANIFKIVRLASPITTDSTMAMSILLEPDKWTLCPLSVDLKAGTTPTFANAINLIDFTSEDICLPLPFNETIILGFFEVQTQPYSSTGYDPSSNFLGKIDLRASSNGNSTRIYCQSYQTPQTVSNEIASAMCTPNTYVCSLEYR